MDAVPCSAASAAWFAGSALAPSRQNASSVDEVITYGDFVAGLPTTAHVHLPYQGADNGVYARTLLFAWDVFSPPGKHFRVTLDRVHVTDLAGHWHV